MISRRKAIGQMAGATAAVLLGEDPRVSPALTGQWARIFLRDPGIVVLDEPTAHLDGHASVVVGETLRLLGRDRTTLVVAHRAETVMLADRVLFLEAGKLRAAGRHVDLAQSDPRYAELFQSGRVRADRPRVTA